MKKIFALCLVVALLLSSCFVARDIGDGVRGVSRQTFNANNMVQNYEYYINAVQDLEGKVVMYNNYIRQLVTSPQNSAIINTEMNGLLAYLLEVSEQYNARSKMMNRAIFKDRNLPFQISVSKNSNGELVLSDM